MKATDKYRIIKIYTDKKQYLPLLLIGDESVAMIERYLEISSLYVGFLDGNPIAVCAVTEIAPYTVEIKNLAVLAEFRCQGFGHGMLDYVERNHSGRDVILGTGETPSTLRFYKSCGYSYSHRIPNFFTDNYPEPIVEEGVLLRDMVYLKKFAKHRVE